MCCFPADAISDGQRVIFSLKVRRANDKGGDRYAVEERIQLRRLFASLRLAVAKTSAPEKTELLKKLERVARG